MRLRISFDESYESVARVMNHSAYALFTSAVTMLMVVLQNVNGLLLTLAGMIDIPGMEVTVVAVVTANRTNALLLP